MWDHTKPEGVRVRPDAPVVGLDIDGVLGDYHRHFIQFASAYLEAELVADWEGGFGNEFHDALGLDLDLYRQIKLAYRQSGAKRIMPTINGADAMAAVQLIRENGIQVWIATTRPWLRLDNVDPDTRYWIRTRLGRVDGLIFGEEKYNDLIDLVGHDRILGVVDDLPDNIMCAHDLGLRSAIMIGEHNAGYAFALGLHGIAKVIDDPTDIPTTALKWALSKEA